MTVSNAKGCWYMVSRFECPVCFRGHTYRTRMEGPAPERAKRYEWHAAYDWCNE